jgi:hypothetical protein
MSFVIKATSKVGVCSWMKSGVDSCRLGPREQASIFFDSRQAWIVMGHVPPSIRQSGIRLSVESTAHR